MNDLDFYGIAQARTFPEGIDVVAEVDPEYCNIIIHVNDRKSGTGIDIITDDPNDPGLIEKIFNTIALLRG